MRGHYLQFKTDRDRDRSSLSRPRHTAAGVFPEHFYGWLVAADPPNPNSRFPPTHGRRPRSCSEWAARQRAEKVMNSFRLLEENSSVAGLVVERCLPLDSSGLPTTGTMRYHFLAELGAIILIPGLLNLPLDEGKVSGRITCPRPSLRKCMVACFSPGSHADTNTKERKRNRTGSPAIATGAAPGCACRRLRAVLCMLCSLDPFFVVHGNSAAAKHSTGSSREQEVLQV